MKRFIGFDARWGWEREREGWISERENFIRQIRSRLIVVGYYVAYCSECRIENHLLSRHVRCVLGEFVGFVNIVGGQRVYSGCFGLVFN